MNANDSSHHQPAAGSRSPAPAPAGPTASSAAGILVADASPLFLRGLLHVLAHTFTECSLYEAANPTELLLVTSRWRPALVLLSANLARTPDALLVLLRQLQGQHASVKILVFLEPVTGFGPASQHALRQQVSGLLTRAASPAQVCDAVREALQCNLSTCPPRPAASATRAGANRFQATGGFSSRQLEILHLIAEEWSNEEIADFLCTSVRTVEYHRSQMLHRVGTRTTLGLVLFAHRQGLLPLLATSPLPAARV